MAVGLRIKYYGDASLKKSNRPYKFQIDYTSNGKRVREIIDTIKVLPSDTKEERKQKKELAERIRSKLEIELGNKKEGLISRQLLKANFITFVEELSKKKKESTRNSWIGAIKHMKEFHGPKIKFEDVTTSFLEDFQDYLLTKISSNGAITYLNSLNAALNFAVKKKIIYENPYRFADKPKKEETEMVFLLADEIKEIIKTSFFDNEVKNAFLFSCYTGLRISDIQQLNWSMINDNGINLKMQKTSSAIYIPLNDNAKTILKNQSHNKSNVFNLSVHGSSINRTLRKLIKKTKINKDVSFHSGRHSFATLLITSGVNIFTVSKLLGHKDIKSTLVYAKVIDEVKDIAVNKMPNFNF